MRVVQNIEFVCLAAIAAWIWQETRVPGRLGLLELILLVPLNASILQYAGLYESHRIEGTSELLRNLLSAQIASLSLVAILIPFHAGLNGLSLLVYFTSGFAILSTERLLLYGALSLVRSRGFDVRRACVIGSRDSAVELDSKFHRRRDWGLRVCYWGEAAAGDQIVFHSWQSGELVRTGLQSLLHHEAVDEVLVFSRPSEVDSHRALLTLCRDYGVTVRLVLTSEPSDEPTAEPQFEEFLGSASIAVHGGSFAGMPFFFKRLMDVAGSFILLVALLPVFGVIAVLVKLSSPGAVLFSQRRVGRGGRHFTMYKFRSMVSGAEGMLSRVAARNITAGPVFKSRDDWRVTTVGMWLRRYSLDELPQLYNVLRGEMSLVGPRPLPVHEALGVEQAHRRRFVMRPGLTCVWQVSGRSEIPFASWMRMDLEYVDRWSLWSDAKLLCKTIPAVLAGRGAY